MNLTPTEAAHHLADILKRENQALKRVDYAAAVALVPAKEAALAALTRHRNVPPELTGIGRQLSDLAGENKTLLERAIVVQTRIVRIVANAIKPAPAQYGGKLARTRTIPLALSTRA